MRKPCLSSPPSPLFCPPHPSPALSSHAEGCEGKEGRVARVGADTLYSLLSPAPTAVCQRVDVLDGVTAGYVRLHCGGDTGVSLKEATESPQLWRVSRAELQGPGKDFTIPPQQSSGFQ